MTTFIDGAELPGPGLPSARGATPLGFGGGESRDGRGALGPAPVPGARSAPAARLRAHFHFLRQGFALQRKRAFFVCFKQKDVEGTSTEGRRSKEISVARAYGGG